ncbi:MAG: hypothetical protein HY552_03735 [Elusimicrobia bacterium]|nr:hypothetical protein [Elusimicrobiota bacterium]
MANVVYYVSGHGYGHATRSALILEALAAELPGLHAAARTSAPAALFSAGVEVSVGAEEPMPVQRDPWTADWEATLAAHRDASARRARDVAAEAEFLRRFGADLVLTDVPSLACEAAAAAGLPAWIVSNFTWDWIYAEKAAEDPRWAPVADLLSRGYAQAAGALRLPMSGGFSCVARVEDVGLVARRSRRSRAEARAALGVPDDGRPLVLVSFGGVPPDRLRVSGDLSAWRFAGLGPAPEGLSAPWTALGRGGAPHAEAVAACDALLGKPGYGTFSEAAAHGVRVLYVDRPAYAESRALTSWIRANARAAELPRPDYEAGDWGPALAALFARPSRPPVPSGGAAQIARRLRALIEESVRN